MRKIISIFLLFFSLSSLTAQSYIGFLSDNYSGVYGVVSNPANIVDSRFKTDINVGGVSVFTGNDYYGVNVFDAFKDEYDFDLDATKSPSNDNNFALYSDLLGPSFMFNLNEKSSIAIFTRARYTLNVNEINGNTIGGFDNDDSTVDFNVNEGDFNVFGQAWAELGLTYAKIIKDSEQHFIKGGLSLKYLQGLGSAYGYGRNVTIDYDADGTDLGGGRTTANINSTGEITYARFDDYEIDDYDYDLPDANGFAIDLGVVYEWRPNYADYKTINADGDTYVNKYENKYKLKLGLSITDIGGINYKDGIEETYDITNAGVSEEDIENADDIDDVLNSFYTQTNTQIGYKTKLPTALHLNADWSFNKNLYLNLNTDLSLVSQGKENGSRISNIASLTPRFESKVFSFYLPLSVIQNTGFQAGAGFKLGPLFIGSGSILSVLTSDDSKGADVYAGAKFSFFHRKPRDKDEDGVIDKLDGCPKEAGPIENNGCPWGDKDEDGVLDNIDDCPEEAGAEENNGCPWGDADGDTLLDNIDECPYKAGPIENKGCPWPDTDGDSVLDKDDQCIDVVGTVANNGCPEVVEIEPVVTKEIQKTLNEYAKTILFNSGKSSIRTESSQVLEEIVAILNEYPSAKFSIEGHTDSVGSSSSNLLLSENRASSVMKFLIEKGIPSSQLSSKGFGESNPVASNASATGRSENRRVEINLIK